MTDGCSKSWTGTLNNWTHDELESMKSMEGLTYGVIGKEVGESGTPHLQFCLTFKGAQRFNKMHKLLPRAHLEVVINLAAARKYCEKEGDVEYVDQREQGNRSDLAEAAVVLQEGNMLEVARTMPIVFVKYYKGLQMLKSTLERGSIPEWREMSVIVLIGVPGSGKSREARRLYPELYNVPEPVNGGLWFDGYDGQNEILMDDFYGSWMRYHTLLQLLDGYRMLLPIKGGFVNKNWHTVVITSNRSVEQWYGRPEISALTRRITEIRLV